MRHPHTQGKVERFYGSLEQARCKRDLPPPGSRQIWLDRFRDDYNRVEPHGALGMQTPASVLTASPRSYNPDPHFAGQGSTEVEACPARFQV